MNLVLIFWFLLIVSLLIVGVIVCMCIWCIVKVFGCGVLWDGVYLLFVYVEQVVQLCNFVDEVCNGEGQVWLLDVCVDDFVDEDVYKVLFDCVVDYMGWFVEFLEVCKMLFELVVVDFNCM